MQLTHLYLYPIKSLGGISVSQATLSDRGLEHDRRWMVVNENGTFFTQRQLPEMAQISVSQSEMGWRLTHKRKRIAPVEVPLIPQTDEWMQVEVWGEAVQAQVVSPQVDSWLSMVLGESCRLVYMPEESHRPVDPDYAKAGELVGFADGFPFLLISQESLDSLNEKLAEPVLMDRFRPNFVVSGVGKPHAEDEWKRFHLGEIEFIVAKPCGRCQIITIDQQTTQQSAEPLKTLSTYRRQGKKVCFGMNLLHRGSGTLEAGMEVKL
ncbi:MAG: MOSC N-terminal beta barrel domain-containing protein [Bacteroidota bacterium]